jgi:hypothetical protein
MTSTEWAVVLGLAVLPVPLFELWKLLGPKPPTPPRASVIPASA